MHTQFVSFIGFQQPPLSKRPCKDHVPSALNVAPSVASKDAKKFIDPKRRMVPLYSHWFATDMHDINIKLEESNGYSLPPMEKLTECATKFTNVVSNDTGNGFLSANALSHEDTFSSLLTPVLKKLLSTILNVGVFNQLIIRVRNHDNRQVDKPDNTIAVEDNDIPVRCIAVSDSKRQNAQEGKNQVHAYGLALESNCLFLGLTIIRASKIYLQLFMAFEGKLSVIDICEASCDEMKDLEKFFGTLYAAVDKLAQEPITAPPHQFTQKCCEQEVPDRQNEHKNLSCSGGPLVLYCPATKMVKKYYDKKFDYVPSSNAITFIPQSKFLKSPCSRYQILQYPFIEGHNELRTPAQAAAAVRELNKFHEKGFVHGDIRSINMIVSDNNAVTFIDVDLVEEEGKFYPSGYNHQGIPERHNEAKAHYPMKKVHDRFALQTIIVKGVELPDSLELTDMEKSLEEIAVAFESMNT